MKTEQSREESLQQIWERLAAQGYETDKGSVHSYISVYEEILKQYRETAQNVLEIGLFNGHSMRMWEQYFTQAKVNGIDCDEQPHGGLGDLRPMIAEGSHYIFIADATKPEDIEKCFEGVKFDFICDDGGHSIESQIQSFTILKNYMKKGGIYIIEDIQDIDANRSFFESLDPNKNIEIIDRRSIKNRYDDVIVIITDK